MGFNNNKKCFCCRDLQIETHINQIITDNNWFLGNCSNIYFSPTERDRETKNINEWILCMNWYAFEFMLWDDDDDDIGNQGHSGVQHTKYIAMASDSTYFLEILLLAILIAENLFLVILSAVDVEPSLFCLVRQQHRMYCIETTQCIGCFKSSVCTFTY